MNFMPSRNVHLVGSVPLANAHEVFVTVSAALGPRLLRIPDGETGERIDWIAHLEPLFANHPALEKSDEVFRLHPTAPGRTRYRLKPGALEAGVTFGNLFYADVAIRSYQDFARLKQQGKIPAHCRFQVDLVPAHSVIWLFLQDNLHRAFDPIYNDAVRREIDKLAESIPHEELAIQFDVASAVFARLQRNEPNAYGRNKDEMLEAFGAILGKLADHVPGDIELLFHFCYGDSNHRHVVEPIDMGDMVDLANRLAGGINRSIELIHMPVPRDRSDDAYFAPLTPQAEAGHATLSWSRALHGRDRGHAPPPRHGGKICEKLLDRDGMRVRPAAAGDYIWAVGNSRRCGGVTTADAPRSRVVHGRIRCDDTPDPCR